MTLPLSQIVCKIFVVETFTFGYHQENYSMPEDQTTSFSTSGEEAITQVIDIQPDNSANTLSPKEFDDFYEIERTADEIIEGDYKRVCV